MTPLEDSNEEKARRARGWILKAIYKEYPSFILEQSIFETIEQFGIEEAFFAVQIAYLLDLELIRAERIVMKKLDLDTRKLYCTAKGVKIAQRLDRKNPILPVDLD